VIIIVSATVVLIAAAARRARFSYEVEQLRKWRETGGQHQYTLGYADFEDRLLNYEIPRADFSQGGVLFFGSSNVKVSLKTWELPPEEERCVANYALSAARHSFIERFIRYLVDEEDMAAAGDRMMVVFGLFYNCAAADPKGISARFATGLFQRHGLYTFGETGAIRTVPMTRLERLLRLEKVNLTAYLRRALSNPVTDRTGLTAEASSVVSQQQHDPEAYTRRWREGMGPNWREAMPPEVEALGRTIGRLQARRVQVACYLTPIGSWHRQLPFPEAYRKLVETTLAEHGVPLHDLTRLLSDDEFQDSTHANYRGQAKYHEALMRIAREHLRSLGP